MNNVICVSRTGSNRAALMGHLFNYHIGKMGLEGTAVVASMERGDNQANFDSRINSALSRKDYSTVQVINCRPLTEKVISEGSIVLTASPKQREFLREEFDSYSSKIFSLPEYSTYGKELYAGVNEPTRDILDVHHVSQNADEEIEIARRAERLPVLVAWPYLLCAAPGKIDSRRTGKIQRIFTNMVNDVDSYVIASLLRMKREGIVSERDKRKY